MDKWSAITVVGFMLAMALIAWADSLAKIYGCS